MSHLTKDHYAEISVNTAKVQVKHKGTEQGGDLHQLFTGFISDPHWCSNPPACTALPGKQVGFGYWYKATLPFQATTFAVGLCR